MATLVWRWGEGQKKAFDELKRQQLIKFLVIHWHKPSDEDPHKQVTSQHMEMVEEIMFNPAPANQEVSFMMSIW